MVEYYTGFIPNFVDNVEPVRPLLRKGQRFVWSYDIDASFRKAKDAQASNKVLKMFDASLPVLVSTDELECGLGVVLEQADGHKHHRVAFPSRVLSPAERNYSVGERERMPVTGHASGGMCTSGDGTSRCSLTLKSRWHCFQLKGQEGAPCEWRYVQNAYYGTTMP